MKKIVFVFIAAVMFFGCNRESELEIIPNYDFEYMKVTDYVKLTQSLIPAETKKRMSEEINEIFSKRKNEDNHPKQHLYELFIGESGKVEKVEIPKHIDMLLNEKILSKIKNWQFGNYIVDGVKTKYRMPLTIMSITNNDGKTSAFIIGYSGDIIDEEVFFVAVEEMPAPIGGIRAIQNKVVYPEEAKRAGIEGRVFVKAFIDSTGTVVKTTLLRGIGGGCDEAAMDAVKNVKFIPGMQRGKPVNVQVTVPILFKLK